MKKVNITTTFIEQELEGLAKDKLAADVTNNIKKAAFAEDIKNKIGNDLKTDINNPNRHNPRKQTFWSKLRKTLNL